MPKFKFSAKSCRVVVTEGGPGGVRRYWEGVNLHREDGPAVLFPNGEFYWFLNGKQYNFFNWWERTGKTYKEIFSMMNDIEEEITILKLKHFEEKNG